MCMRRRNREKSCLMLTLPSLGLIYQEQYSLFLLLSYILMAWLFCLRTDRLLLWFSASETRKSSITNYRWHTHTYTGSIAGPELSSCSIRLSTNQNRSNAGTQRTEKKIHLAMSNNLFLRSLLRNHCCNQLHHDQCFFFFLLVILQSVNNIWKEKVVI